MTWTEWLEIPLPILILLGVLTLGLVILLWAHLRLAKRHRALYGKAVGIDDDLATAEDNIKRLQDNLTAVSKHVGDVKSQLTVITRPPVRPNVPPTEPFTEPYTGGRHAAATQRPPVPPRKARPRPRPE